MLKELATRVNQGPDTKQTLQTRKQNRDLQDCLTRFSALLNDLQVNIDCIGSDSSD